MEKAKIMQFDREVEYSQNGILSKQIIKNKGGNVTLFAFDKDQALSEHTAPFDALVQILDGEVKITIAKDAFDLCAGDSIILPSGVPHSVLAKTQFRMLLTMIKE